MYSQPAKNLGFFEKDAINDSIQSIRLVKLGREVEYWDYYSKLNWLKDCQDNIDKMLLGKPAKYIINRAGAHWYSV